MTSQLHYQNGDLENGLGLKAQPNHQIRSRENDELALELQKLGIGFSW